MIMDAMKYSKAGVTTYAYYLDFEAFDIYDTFFIADRNPPGLPHGSELFYSFGAYENPAYRQAIGMGNISEWEFEIGKELGNRINQFINDPIDEDWIDYSNNQAIYVIRNNKTNGVYGIEYGTAPNLQSQNAFDKWDELFGSESFGTKISLSVALILSFFL